MKEQVKRKHLQDIEMLTGLAIFLVVLGHLVTGQDINAPGLEWYKYLKSYLYSFHMPLFMFVSGVVFYYTLPKFPKLVDFWEYIKKKIRRLFPSYMLFAILIFFAKLISEKYLKVDNPINGLEDFALIFYKPASSFAGFLWYVYVLFLYFLTLPFLLKKIKLEILIFIALGLYFIRFPEVLSLRFYFEYLFFFLLGALLVKHYKVYVLALRKYWFIPVAIFIGLSITHYFYGVPKFVMGLASISALHAFVLVFGGKERNVLSTLGKYSFSIYLMNTLVMGFVKAIGFKYFGFSYSNFIIIAIIMVFLGSLIPVIIKKYVFNNTPYIGKYLG